MKTLPLALLALLAVIRPASAAPWVEFVDETAARLAAAPDAGANDPDEKTFGWGDLDHDGDTDLVVVRKVPFVATGKRPNLLLLNEGGVLTDRTAELATASDVPGDLGFATPTSDRDVVVVDVDLDGWLDVVTAAALSDGDPKHIGHPRVYRNLGCDEPCGGTADWLGLRYEDARIPTMLTYEGQAGANPRFAAVVAGDVTGDGYPDLWFSDYDSSGSSISIEPPGTDFNDRLLVNQGAANPGYFSDATSSLLGTFDLPTGQFDVHFEVSNFSPSAALADFDGNGAVDILKANANANLYVAIAFNDPVPGAFAQYTPVPNSSVYAVSVADLDRDGKLDIIETSDGDDRYLLNRGNGSDGLTDFLSYPFEFSHSGTGIEGDDAGLGGDNIAADLDRDGWLDVLIADVDVDILGCGRRLNIYRNLGESSGGPGLLEEQTSGSNCAFFHGNPPSCLVTGIPASELKGTFDVAPVDINGDGWLDLVLGRCVGTRVLVNQPPAPAGAVPDGSDAGELLRVRSAPHQQLELSWGESCLDGDTDYAVYAGEIGAPFTAHAPILCTTLGATAAVFDAPAGSTYFLVVAHNGEAEGSYGLDSAGNERSPSGSACRPQHIATCD